MPDYLASDGENPNFIGKHNPDDTLSVMFYSKPLRNNYRSEQEARPCFDNVDMVKIHMPGDDKLIIDTAVREEHKVRFPRQWTHYQSKSAGDQRLIGKTPIGEWPRVDAAMAEELRAMKFIAVEDVANASDAALQRIGMVAGMQPFAFREAAQRFLRLAKTEAAETAADTRLKEMEATHAQERDQMQAQMRAMQEQLARIAAAQPVAGVPDLAALGAQNAAQDPPQARRKG